MESTAGIAKLKPGSKKDFAEWREAINSRKAEVLESLRQERVDVECWFEVEINGEPYLLWFIRVESLEKARETLENSTLEIDLFHKEKMKRMIEPRIEAKLVAELYVE
ncbi:MAG: DUF6176 family protein [Pseudomonadota bacterium]